ncbi:unnamed protein product [Rotaria magnacalcarata]|uniref:Uncharacterized protein n=1 Tax=Rotaria magnacalcarata TaxID=392030 RepID=A0A8S3IVL2_9BILA|nr:unnamed protein product [Rotaria magnacalcarata]
MFVADNVKVDCDHVNHEQRQQLLTIVDRGTYEQLFIFLQAYHQRPFRNLDEVMRYDGVIDDQIDFIDCMATKYTVTPLMIAAGKGSYEKTKILLVHGANPNAQCSTGSVGRMFFFVEYAAFSSRKRAKSSCALSSNTSS